MITKVENFLWNACAKLINKKLVKDQKGGESLEKAGDNLFVGIVVVGALVLLGTLLNSVFTKVMTSIKTTFGIA